jgi:seryl-tRNA(Sec) selenium transferase
MMSFKETIQKIKKETLGSALRVVGIVLFLLVLAFSFILWQQWNAKRQQAPQGETIDEQKKAILESLSAPPPQYTNEEKQQILKSLSAPSSQPALSDEEKKSILESLSAPQQ